VAEELLYAETRGGEMLAEIRQKEASSGGGTSQPVPAGIDGKRSPYAQSIATDHRPHTLLLNGLPVRAPTA